MKLKALLFTALLATFTTPAFAQWFPGTVRVNYLPHMVTAEVFNPHFQPIICNGQVFGQTWGGPVQTAFFAEQFMPVGSYRYAYVYSNGFANFVSAWANIHCRFAW